MTSPTSATEGRAGEVITSSVFNTFRRAVCAIEFSSYSFDNAEAARAQVDGWDGVMRRDFAGSQLVGVEIV